MFFLQHGNKKQFFDKPFLTHFRSVPCISFFANTPLVLLKKIIQNLVVRRMSFRFLLKKCMRGGITLEAAMVIPIFIFFVLNMFSVMEMLRFYGNMSYALNEVGGKTALYGYLHEIMVSESDSGVLQDITYGYAYVKNQLTDILGEEYIRTSPVVDGEEGIVLIKSKLKNKDCVEFTVIYEMEVPFGFGVIGNIRIYQSYRGRSWTGYDVTVNDGQVVYVTEYGSVYHTNKNCTYLSRNVEKVQSFEVTTLKNAEGKKYTPCSLCGMIESKVVWITRTGERYHSTEECSAINRKICEITLAEAKEREMKLCNRCKER